MNQRESVILCEGYHDRAFWSGWLRHLRCKVPINPNSAMAGKVVMDPWGMKVVGGQFGLLSKSDEFVRIVPCGGDDKIRPALRTRLRERSTRELRRLVVGYDADSDARKEPDASQGVQSAHDSVQNVLKEFDPHFTTDPNGHYLRDGGTTVVSVVVWWAPDPQAPGLPWKHTLERLVCAALNAALPGRDQAVEQWLQSRPGGPSAGAKEYAWSNMAGWYAEKGCEAFYSELWSDQQTVVALQSRLGQTGAWRIGQAVAA
jgi:hypothetical protein